MSDSDGKKTLGVRGGGPRSGNVKQSFSHGRSKNVVVETSVSALSYQNQVLQNLPPVVQVQRARLVLGAFKMPRWSAD